MPAREQISHVDTAWLRMDRPNNLMQIVGVMIFEGPVDFARVRETIAARLLRYRRFRQKAVVEGGSAWWEDDAAFDLDAHLRHVILPPPGDTRTLQKYVAQLTSTALDPQRPRWEMQVVETASGDSALIARIHHAIADGIALIGVLLSLTDARPDAPPEQALPPWQEAVETEDASGPGEMFWRYTFAPLGAAALSAIRLSGNLWVKYVSLMLDPGQAAGLLRMGAGIAAEVGKLAVMANDSPTRFKGRPGVEKCVAWSEPIALPEVKAVGKVLGCSVNDLLLASVAGALAAYLRDRGDSTRDIELRALVPVNLRRADDAGELGNRFGLVALELPVGVDNPLARLYATRQRMEALKGSWQAALTLSILGAMGMAPKFLQQQVLDLLANKATAVMTNVPGPQQPLWFAGARLKEQMFWVPQSGNIGMGVSILSYDGRVQFGLITDRALVPDPETIVARFAHEFDKLLWLVLMEPWERLDDPDAVAASLAG